MRKTFYGWMLSLFFILSAVDLAAQSNRLHHVPHTKAIEFVVGRSEQLTFGAGYLNFFPDNHIYFRVGGAVERGDFGGINYFCYMLDFRAAYSLINWKEIIYIAPEVGIGALYDGIDNLEGVEISNSLNYGAFVGVDAEIYFSPRLATTLNFNQRQYIREPFGERRFYYSVGLKYTFH